MKVHYAYLLGSLVSHVLAANPDGIDFWWTALGDSYASGVGSTTYIDGKRCLRYDEAYPQKMQGNDELGNGKTDKEKRLLQNVVCSGAEAHDVNDYQLLDEDTWGVPSIIQYGNRPKFGEPAVGTLTLGGDDIDFPGILFNCILESHIPGGGPPFRTCPDQRAHSWELIRSQKLIDDIADTIDKIVTKARKGPIGDKFILYVTGYGQFFNEKTDLCNEVTFARSANPKDDGKEHQKMTKEIRTDFNSMSRGLNDAIKKAVDKHKDKNVKYIDIDAALEGHRFCEENIHEPDQDNKNLWLWHYPYNKETKDGDDKYNDIIAKANDKVFGSPPLSIQDLSGKYASARAVDDAWYDALDGEAIKTASGGDVEAQGFWDGVVGWRAKLFHPQPPWHDWIEDKLIEAWKADRDVDSVPDPTPGPGPTQQPDRWSYTFQSYTGNLGKGEFSWFVLPGRYNGRFDEDAEYQIDYLDHPVKVYVFTQDGDKGKEHGPFDIDCSADDAEDHWTGFPPDKIGTKWDLVIQPGHACAYIEKDFNWDNLHVKYAADYLNVPDEIGDNKKCVEHDNGVTCNVFHD